METGAAITKIKNSKNVTKADILKEANEIWKECQEIWKGIKPTEKKSRGKVRKVTKQIKESDYKILDDMYEKVRDKHRDLAIAYPTVLRHMIQEMNYSPEVFAKYLDKLEKAPYTNDETRMDSYTDYALMLFEYFNRGEHLNMTQLNAFKRDYRARLQKEHDDFIKNAEEYKKKIEEKLKQVDEVKRKNLLEAFERLAGILGIDSDKVNEVRELVTGGIMQTEYLEKLVLDLRKLYAGELPAD